MLNWRIFKLQIHLKYVTKMVINTMKKQVFSLRSLFSFLVFFITLIVLFSFHGCQLKLQYYQSLCKNPPAQTGLIWGSTLIFHESLFYQHAVDFRTLLLLYFQWLCIAFFGAAAIMQDSHCIRVTWHKHRHKHTHVY